MSKENKEQSTKYLLKRMSKYLYKYKFTIIISIISVICTEGMLNVDKFIFLIKLSIGFIVSAFTTSPSF